MPAFAPLSSTGDISWLPFCNQALNEEPLFVLFFKAAASWKYSVDLRNLSLNLN